MKIKRDRKPVETKETIKYKEVLSDHIGRYFYMKKNGTPIIEVGQKKNGIQTIGSITTIGVNTTICSNLSGVIEEIYIENGNQIELWKTIIKN